MDILYNPNDHVEYWIQRSRGRALAQGRVIGIEETGHKTDAYRIKRDRELIGNVGMYETDVVSPLNIVGLVTTDLSK